MATPQQREALKTLGWGVVWVVGAVAFWLNAAGNPINDLRLALSASIAQGHVVNSWEDAEDGDDGQLHWSHAVAYSVELPNGREVKSGAKGSGRLRQEFANIKEPVAIDVEYLPWSPSVNRIKGSGSQSLGQWLGWKVGLGGLLLALSLVPGLKLLRQGLTEFRSAGGAAHLSRS